MTQKTILMMAGGTGGHVFPALAVTTELQRRGYRVQWLGSEQGIENRLVPAAGVPLHRLKVKGLRGSGVLRKLQMPLQLLRAVLGARRIIRETQASLVVGFGGFASGPGGIAARLAGVPLVIHEQNAVPGLTNRVLASVATRVLEAFDGAFGGRAEAVGNPVREAIAALPVPEVRYAEREGALRLLVLGGSQGALALNQQLPAVLADVFETEPVIIRHQAGSGRRREAEQAYQAAGLDAAVEEFIDDMAAAYGWADLVICRAGASTVSELAVAGVAAVFVPLPSAVDDHQTHNAHWLASRDGAWCVAQSSLTGETLHKVLAGTLNRPALARVAIRARQASHADSARRVADVCEEVLHG